MDGYESLDLSAFYNAGAEVLGAGVEAGQAIHRRRHQLGIAH